MRKPGKRCVGFWFHKRNRPMDPCLQCGIPQVGTEERVRLDFWRKVNKTDTCWLWTGCVYRNGVAQTRYGGKTRAAYHVAYFFTYGNCPVWEDAANANGPRGKVMMHSCDNGLCVNPAHLSIGTQKENLHDMYRKGRGRYQKTQLEKSVK